MEEIIRLEDVWKVYKMGEVEVIALKGINLKIERGDFVIIAGPSGSGKSTMLNQVGCLDTPTKGRVYLDGQDITKLRESQLAQTRGKKIGFVFQQFNLISTLNALDNVILPLDFQNVSSKEAKERALESLELVGLSERIEHLPSQLSGGERQRVAIARAIAVNPEIILADEPTGNLDSKTGKTIIDILMKIHNNGKTLILSTHDPDLMKLAKRNVHLKDAQIEKIER
ncbi:ABC transporter ATP-binding protein [archaeon]|nr:ABC transporter ATP-binding protein [archaeon]